MNFPDGEVFTGPVENSVNGAIRFTFPGIFHGQEIEDIYLRFKDGKVQAALHWDMLKDMRQGGEIYADGALIYRDGRFI